ncbi:MAG: alpha/beta hydrolase [Lentisphaerae bacterium]|nr:alpha/beta hydrolase [Lentisphaerota bacterium]
MNRSPIQKFRMPWGKMACVDTPGDEPPLVFLHGTGCDSGDWERVVSLLRGQARLVRLDFRGHGASDTPTEAFALHDLAADVLTFLEKLDLHDTILVGHSLGGIVAMAAAAKSPRIKGLVLLEGWTNARAQDAFEASHLTGGLDEAALARIQKKDDATLLRFDPDIWCGFCESVQDFDALPWLRKAAIPVWEVYGDCGKTKDTEKLLAVPNNPRIAIRWIQGAGHYLPHEKPVEVAQICAETVAT